MHRLVSDRATGCVTDMERLRSQAALAAFLSELGEAVEQAELVHRCYVMHNQY